jgi:hypothetical protein
MIIMKGHLFLLFFVFRNTRFAHGAEWAMETFPEPEFGLVSDPDGILGDRDIKAISERIEAVTENAQVPLHIAIAVASKMKMPDGEHVDEEKVAAEFARGIHDR